MRAFLFSIITASLVIASVTAPLNAEEEAKPSSVDDILNSIGSPKQETKGSSAGSESQNEANKLAAPPEKAPQTTIEGQTPGRTQVSSIKPTESDLENFPFDHNILPLEYLEMLKAPETDLRKAAAALMERKRKFMMRWDDPSKFNTDANFPKTIDETELLCIFPDKYLDFVIQKGQLNLHQVGHSRGVCEPAIRAHAEDFMVGIHLENTYDADRSSRLHYLRPKYGFVNFHKACGIKVNPFRLLQYGTVVIVYSDEVKLRSSYTYGDSLASYCEPWAITMHPLDPIPMQYLRGPGPDETSNCRYVEAQIWGPIELKDIKEFRIPADRKDILEKLSATGKPIFSYDREKMELNDLYLDIAECGWQRGAPLNAPAIELAKKEQVAQK